ncbi:DUF202 domain-containing protein [Gordonia desulfuricans]|uniref:DUF202 domain-containing protein n=1 Tax=Gordonia desulfuricans TaxID=89051 RepID=A0A7K3LL32_9ACTN|nr:MULTISPECIES: DUF202 domain-containing protein [Gordonia]EMP12646.2 membrane protein [Gordonia sp. NB41Y]NDK88950.1 DUF202 domain-containing protein [Gordonia desulfuricans]WLP88961.1 DUF202 domain-containing protein [Gordonia sp. NB41Y]
MSERASGPADPEHVPTVTGAPDARFTLANERTFLAWIRTALGFIAGGVAVVYIAPDITSSLLESTLGLIMVAVGCAVAVLGVVRWRRTDRVLREGGPMPGPSPVLFVVAAIVMVSIALAISIVVQN